ncbi:hypothetical protein N9K16_03945 [Alphaproteobacteria bacterium]|nr:hypothetical protein [Alphaproteobacteria bacterium]
MWDLHLKQRRGWWYYQRRVPGSYKVVDSSGTISFALKTKDFSEAKLRAAQFSLELEEKWSNASEQNKALMDTKAGKRFQTAQGVQKKREFESKQTEKIPNDGLLDRLRSLLEGGVKSHEQKAVLGMVEKPTLLRWIKQCRRGLGLKDQSSQDQMNCHWRHWAKRF